MEIRFLNMENYGDLNGNRFFRIKYNFGVFYESLSLLIRNKWLDVLRMSDTELKGKKHWYCDSGTEFYIKLMMFQNKKYYTSCAFLQKEEI